MIFWAQFCRKTISFRPALSRKFPQMARTGSFSALLCENSGRRAKFPGKLPRSILKAAIPVERAQVLMASYRSVPCVSPITPASGKSHQVEVIDSLRGKSLAVMAPKKARNPGLFAPRLALRKQSGKTQSAEKCDARP